MERGFVLDNVQVAHGVSQWAPGVPQKSFLTGTKSPAGTLPMAAFRCSTCGYSEIYAREEFAAQ
jgi:hypothetical protein